MRHWDTEKSWSPFFRERVAARREALAYYTKCGFHVPAIEAREHLKGEGE